jgi:NAD(P)H dehydrogenase (quinone)
MTTIAITGATGQLGRLVIQELLKTMPAPQLVALVRDPAKAAGLAAQGVQVRRADYDQGASLPAALAGVDRLLLISSSEVGKRLAQHQAVIDAARLAGVKLLAYTSLLHADSSPLGLAKEHRDTEAAIKASGVPYVLLRNGWYLENYLASVPAALQHKAVLGSAGEGRISSASRADYAAAAAAVLASAEPQAGRTYELAGSQSFSLGEFAAELGRLSREAIAYRNLPEAEYRSVLLGAGLPPPLAALLADSDVGASRGGLHGTEADLERLIGRPSTTLQQGLAAALAH